MVVARALVFLPVEPDSSSGGDRFNFIPEAGGAGETRAAGVAYILKAAIHLLVLEAVDGEIA